MDSTGVAALESLKLNDYLTVALLTVITYDYVLTLPREIDYIWNKCWTIVSVLFLVVRYCGLYILIIYTLMWSSFFPGPAENYFEGEKLYIASIWAFVVWIGASDLVMILRAWAMYNRSRVVLGILLIFWFVELIVSLLTCITYPSKITVVVTQVSNLAYCEVTSAPVTWTEISSITEIVNGAIICVLVVFQFVKRALAMYRATKQWHFNRYVSLFAGQSILYFLFIVFFNHNAILVADGKLNTDGWGSMILLPLGYVPVFALTPRFIISVHALRPSDSQEGEGHETDVRVGLGARHHDCSYPSELDVRKPGNGVVESIPMEEWRPTAERR